MTPNRNSGRNTKETGIAGVKMLVTATSLAAVVGGWAALTLLNAKSSEGEPTATLEDPESLVLELEPIPTLVPEVRMPLPRQVSSNPNLTGGIALVNPNEMLFSGVNLPPGVNPALPKASNDRSLKEGSGGKEKPAKPDKPDPVTDSRPS